MNQEAKTRHRSGRPSAEDTTFYDGGLYKLLTERLTNYVVGGRLNVAKLAPKLGFARWTVYSWFHKDKLTTKAASAILAVAGTRIDREELATFLFD